MGMEDRLEFEAVVCAGGAHEITTAPVQGVNRTLGPRAYGLEHFGLEHFELSYGLNPFISCSITYQGFSSELRDFSIICLNFVG